jgi:hypothetical protein
MRRNIVGGTARTIEQLCTLDHAVVADVIAPQSEGFFVMALRAGTTEKPLPDSPYERTQQLTVCGFQDFSCCLPNSDLLGIS